MAWEYAVFAASHCRICSWESVDATVPSVVIGSSISRRSSCISVCTSLTRWQSLATFLAQGAEREEDKKVSDISSLPDVVLSSSLDDLIFAKEGGVFPIIKRPSGSSNMPTSSLVCANQAASGLGSVPATKVAEISSMYTTISLPERVASSKAPNRRKGTDCSKG